MPSTADDLPDLERRRLRGLVEADATILDAVHAPDFLLVHPSGGVWSKDQYVGGVVSGEIRYRRFEAVSHIEVLTDGNLAVLRYRSVIDIAVRDQPAGVLECWHLDCYRRAGPTAPWQVVWSQATAID